MKIEEHLKSIVPSRDQVERFISREIFDEPGPGNQGWTYDSDLGWVLKDSCRDDGLDGSRTFYRYEKGGCRRRLNCAERPCRIHAYGDSFTHCDQVNDGETWEEYLAAHIREPIVNLGVGGYGVYQAYLRMMRHEAREPAGYVILNIWHDDHFRSLDSWRAIRFGFRTSCGFTLPYLKVDPERGEIVEQKNLCPTAQDVFNLTDPDFVVRTFRDDPVLNDMQVAGHDAGQGGVYARPSAMTPNLVRAALLASERILGWFQRETAKRGQKFMLVLSHGYEIVRAELAGEPRWDGSFVDAVRGQPYPVLDLRDAHREEFARTKMAPDEYLKPYYIGHYSPAGNHFFARALKNAIVDWLDPKPEPYRRKR